MMNLYQPESQQMIDDEDLPERDEMCERYDKARDEWEDDKLESEGRGTGNSFHEQQRNNVAELADKCPEKICADCGGLYGNLSPGTAAWHFDKCDICGKENILTSAPVIFGGLKNT